METIAEKEAPVEVHDPRDDEQPYVRWAPLYVPLFAAALVVFMMLIMHLS
jgi:hypothetical protein